CEASVTGHSRLNRPIRLVGNSRRDSVALYISIAILAAVSHRVYGMSAPLRTRRLGLCLRAGAANTLDDWGGKTRPLGDLPILFFNNRSSGTVAVYSAQGRAWNLAVGSLRTILIDDVEQYVFNARSRFPSHF